MFMAVDRHLYIHLQNSLNSTLKTGERYSVKKYTSKKILHVTHNKSACFSKNNSSKNILLSNHLFVENLEIIYKKLFTITSSGYFFFTFFKGGFFFFLLLFSNLNFILGYSGFIILFSGVQQSESIIHKYTSTFSDSFPIEVIIEH